MIATFPQGAEKTQGELMFEVPLTTRTGSTKKQNAMTKNHAMLSAFVKVGLHGLNRFQAYREYHDSVLNSTIPILQKKYNIHFSRERELVPNFTGGTTSVNRYWLDDVNKALAIDALNGTELENV